MDLKQYQLSLPHLKKVWVKDGEVFIHAVAGAEIISLEDLPSTEETIVQDSPAKPSKKK